MTYTIEREKRSRYLDGVNEQLEIDKKHWINHVVAKGRKKPKKRELTLYERLRKQLQKPYDTP